MKRKIKLDKKGHIVESEADIQLRIVQYLEAHGWFCFQNRSDGLGGKIAAFATTKQSGSPDLFVWGCTKKAWNPGLPRTVTIPRHFAIEVKRKGGKCSESQLTWAGRFCATGHSYVLAYSHEDVERFLKGKGWE